MKVASIAELKKELHVLSPPELIELCLTLARYKNENKELLGYLLFDAGNRELYVRELKAEIETQVLALKEQSNLYYVKKGLRKTLRQLNKHCKFIGDKGQAAELHIGFCQALKKSGIPYHKSQLIVNLYEQELKKINTLLACVHEDYRMDYQLEIDKLSQS